MKHSYIIRTYVVLSHALYIIIHVAVCVHTHVILGGCDGGCVRGGGGGGESDWVEG